MVLSYSEKLREETAMVYLERSYNAGNNGQKKKDMKFSADKSTQEK